jgi:hypothetical protein
LFYPKEKSFWLLSTSLNLVTMASGTSLDRLASPIQFAVKTSLDANTIATWMAEMTKAFREYAENIERRVIFSGYSGRRVTPRGTISAQNRVQAENVTKSILPRFLTNSKEAKSLQATLISTVYTEILIAIIYLHHRAFELEDLIIFSCRLSEWIGRQANAARLPTFIVNAVKEHRGIAQSKQASAKGPSDEKAPTQAIVPNSFSTAVQSTAPHADGPHEASVIPKDGTSSSAPSSQAAISPPPVPLDTASLNRIYLPGEIEERRTKLLIELWYKAFRLYVTRNPFCYADVGRHLDDMGTMTASKSLERFQHRLEDIRNNFPKISAEHGRNRPLTLDSADEVILFRADDFGYPFDASWFELMHMRSKQGMGHERLDAMARDLTQRGGASPLTRMHSTIAERLERDIRENLLPAIAAADDRLRDQIVIKNEFVSSVACVIADYIIDASIEYFNYAVGFTDMASGTTIQLRAVKTIFLQMQSACLLPLTAKQVSFLNDVMTHAIGDKSSK